jgi:hypothetical protein
VVYLTEQGSPTIEDYAEIVGLVMAANKIKMMTCINMGRDLGEFNPQHLHCSRLMNLTLTDMGLANDLVELIHGPQKEIREMFF